MVNAFQGAIIAAGRGDRLRATSGISTPKPLVPVEGVPLLVRQANAMISAGASDVLAVINSETASMASAIEFPAGLHITVRDTESSMESLFVLGEHLKPGSFLLATVDTMLPMGELARFVARARELTAAGRPNRLDGVLAVVRWRGDRNPLFTETDNLGLIRALGRRESEMVTAGVYWLSTEIFRFVSEARRRQLSALRAFLQMLIEEQTRLGAVEVIGAIDIDEASDLDAARRMVMGQP
jgi:NDP-sugar pyrophosphorylase family protein